MMKSLKDAESRPLALAIKKGILESLGVPPEPVEHQALGEMTPLHADNTGLVTAAEDILVPTYISLGWD